MAWNPPFELEDQTDEDFFDNLVNDDDDVFGGGGGLKSVDSTNAVSAESESVDVFGGDEFDEVKGFGDLSISEGGNVSDFGVASRGIESIEGNDNVDDGVGLSRVIGGECDVGEVVKEERIGEGDVIHSALSSDSFTFENGHVSEFGVTTPVAKLVLRDENNGSTVGGVKEVQWSSFSNLGEDSGAGFGSYSDLFTDLGDAGVESVGSETKIISGDEQVMNTSTGTSYGHSVYQGGNGVVAEQSLNEVDTNSTAYWENLYPGWKYDTNTGQWYQSGGSDAATNVQVNIASVSDNVQGNFDASGGGDNQWGISDVQTSQAFNAQQTTQTDVGTVSQFSTTNYGQDHLSQQYGQYQYPAHMIFDPQYPGWYYDTIASEWRSLETYHSSSESMNQTFKQQAQNGFFSSSDYSHDNAKSSIGSGVVQGLTSGNVNQSWVGSSGSYSEQGTNVQQFGLQSESWSAVNSSGGRTVQSSYDPMAYSNSNVNQQNSSNFKETVTSYGMTNQNSSSSKWVSESHSFVPTNHTFQHYNQIPQVAQNGPVPYQDSYYGSQNVASISQPFIPNDHHNAYASNGGRSSAGRPPHALVTFGFGGKLVVMKDNSTHGFSSLASKEPDGHSISVLSLMEVVNTNNGMSGSGSGSCSYLHSLCQQSFPGPLVSGSAGMKELNKWIDDRITDCDLHMDFGKAKVLRLLLALLKVACQHYGKLRTFGVDTGLTENDLPESAIAKLFASAKGNDGQYNEFGATVKCFMNLPSEAQNQATAAEVQNLLILGRKKEALQHAQEGQSWGLALIIAQQLGDEYYADTVKQMAISQLVVGSPLRTLCLLIAKKPEEVFSTNITAAGNMRGAIQMSTQFAQNAGYSMLDNWEENLAVITANRTDNDHLVITHMGDCLWKEKSDVIAAHICYLIAAADFESYSNSARLCLIGTDHVNFPRTFATPEAIQRTEVFEYSKILGNSQFVLLPLQPYKLIYAHMLSEVGKASDALKYCQAVHKSLKTGRSTEVDTLKQCVASLEERIKTHQQSGYNLAPAKIIDKLFNFFDSTAQRVVGLPPPIPATTQGNIQGNEHQFQTPPPQVLSSQSTMAASSLMTSSLMSSASMEPISQWAVDGSRMTVQNRSISEPNIGRIPKPDQGDSANVATSSSSDGKQTSSKGTSRFGRFNFGVQILQKTVGLVLKPRQGHQAKLGESNKFYYDTNLNRWVEEGVEQPAAETAPPPPPTTATFQNGTPDYNSMNALNYGLYAADHSPVSTSLVPPSSNSGIPAIPPSSNQFSARGLMVGRSRYVDSFNKGGSASTFGGGASTNVFQTPSVPSAKPLGGITGPKFFIPTAAPSNNQPSISETKTQDQIDFLTPMNDPFQNLAPSPMNDPFQNLSPSPMNDPFQNLAPSSMNDPFQNLTPSSLNDPFQNLAPSSMNDPFQNLTPLSLNDPFQNLAPSPVGTMQRFPSVGNIPNNKITGIGNSPLSSQSRRTASMNEIHTHSHAPPTTTELKASPLAFMPRVSSSSSQSINGGDFGDDLQEVEL